EHDDRTNPFGIGGGKVQRIMGTERETNYGQTAIRFFGATPEKCYRVSDFGLGLEMIGVECFGQRLRIRNGVDDLAVIKIGREYDETRYGQLRAESPHVPIQAPPGMQNQYTGTCAGKRGGKKTRRMLMHHLYLS